jgi:hypothetical protein
MFDNSKMYDWRLQKVRYSKNTHQPKTDYVFLIVNFSKVFVSQYDAAAFLQT